MKKLLLVLLSMSLGACLVRPIRGEGRREERREERHEEHEEHEHHDGDRH
jgi:hypothetical protein